MAVIRRHANGQYDWQCEGCSKVTANYGPHRGPRASLCKTCKNVKDYARRVPPEERKRRTAASDRYQPDQLQLW